MPQSAPPSTASASTQRDGGGWKLEHSYGRLPKFFHTAVEPTLVRAPRLVIFNQPLAIELGLDPDAFTDETAAAIFAGNVLPSGAAPLAQAYAGHQFGNLTTLGDGRAILLGEQITPGGGRFDIQLKGPGPTPYSRRGDGRASLGPMLREYAISEAMHALRIPTTRSLAVAATGEEVWRQEGALPGAVLTRVASSHLRVGTFEWAAAGGADALKALTVYTIQRHFPDLAEVENPPLALINAVIERQAALIAQWLSVGFIHGVMNTDNMALSGETIDYGPCAFMDAYDPATVFSSIDRNGRYSYGNQPSIAQWNLARFAETLLPLLDPDESAAIELATAAVQNFSDRFQHHWLAIMRKKLGLFNEEQEDLPLIEELFEWMHATGADFTNTFANLSHPETSHAFPSTDETFHHWQESWQARLTRQPQSLAESIQLRRDHNPLVIPRNHLVEAALAAAGENDLTPLHELLEVLATPYDHQRQIHSKYRSPSPEGGGRYRTFCGT